MAKGVAAKVWSHDRIVLSGKDPQVEIGTEDATS